MASRFVIEELKTSSQNSNTRKSTILWIEIFKKWVACFNIGEDMDIRGSRI
jgi:hypothetical protein